MRYLEGDKENSAEKLLSKILLKSKKIKRDGYCEPFPPHSISSRGRTISRRTQKKFKAIDNHVSNKSLKTFERL